MEDSQIAAGLAAQLATRIGTQRYQSWFGPQTQLCVEGDRLTVHAASPFVRDCLRKNFGDDLRACFEALVGTAARVEFSVDERLGDQAAHDGAIDRGAGPAGAAEAASNGAAQPTATGERWEADQAPAVPFRRVAALAGFVVGGSNEYAFRAAELTARGRQQASPLYFYGPTGVGKSHLLRGIQGEYRRWQPRGAAVYLTAEQFTTSFVQAIRGSGLPSFRQKCRGADLLLIDDVQFFIGKQRTIEELQYTVDTLVAAGRQVVLAGDRNIAELRQLGPELCSRLAGGLTCEIEPPDFETRVGIAHRLAEEIGLGLGDEVARLVATEITAGARELRGALHRLHAVSLAYGEPVTREMVLRTLNELARHSTRPVRLADVEKVVCDVFGVEPSQLRSDRKRRALQEPRMLAMWLARKYTRSAWSEIGEFFGRRAHSTVISAHKRVERLITTKARIGLSDSSCDVEEAIRKLETALRSA